MLLPCPFCGSAAELLEDSIGAIVACSECDVGTYDRHAMPAKAVATWNRRSPPPTPKPDTTESER